MKILRPALFLALLSTTTACGSDAKSGAATSSSAQVASAAAAAAPPADAKTVADFKAANPSKGSAAKVHGFVGSNKGTDWVVVDKVGEVMPFVFCRMTAAPPGVGKGARVVIEGTVEDTAMIDKCTLRAL